MDRVKRSEPGIAMQVPDMPDRVRASGIEFIEFAADEKEADGGQKQGVSISITLETIIGELFENHRQIRGTLYENG